MIRGMLIRATLSVGGFVLGTIAISLSVVYKVPIMAGVASVDMFLSGFLAHDAYMYFILNDLRRARSPE